MLLYNFFKEKFCDEMGIARKFFENFSKKFSFSIVLARNNSRTATSFFFCNIKEKKLQF